MKENRLAPATPSMLAEHEETAIVRGDTETSSHHAIYVMFAS